MFGCFALDLDVGLLVVHIEGYWVVVIEEGGVLCLWLVGFLCCMRNQRLIVHKSGGSERAILRVQLTLYYYGYVVQ